MAGTKDTVETAQKWDPSSDWDPASADPRKIGIPLALISYVDKAVAEKLPLGSRIKGIRSYGASYWTRTAEIQTEQEDGGNLSFFMKITQKDAGRAMVSGEFASMTAIHNTLPDFAPEPIACGTYSSDPKTHFFLCQFVGMTNKLPKVDAFPAKLAELHQKGTSPTGKYGFDIPTCAGSIPRYTKWTNGWEEFFTNSVKHLLAFEQVAQGPNEELDSLLKILYDRLIPRLLRPLETGGRDIQPSLVHGDLWDGNASTDAATDRPQIFDACSIYAHNEFELGPWRPARHKLDTLYAKQYHNHFQPSEPREDRDARNLLYSFAFNIYSAALWAGNINYRHIHMHDLRSLIEMVPESYEEWAKVNGEVVYPRKE